MDYWIYDYEHRFIVHIDNVNDALNWLSENGIHNPYFDTTMDNDLVLIDSKDGMFGGDAYSHVDMEDAYEFIEKFCEPGSYACFRNDTEYEFHIIWKTEEGVHERYEKIWCPFERLMNVLKLMYEIN